VDRATARAALGIAVDLRVELCSGSSELQGLAICWPALASVPLYTY